MGEAQQIDGSRYKLFFRGNTREKDAYECTFTWIWVFLFFLSLADRKNHINFIITSYWLVLFLLLACLLQKKEKE